MLLTLLIVADVVLLTSSLTSTEQLFLLSSHSETAWLSLWSNRLLPRPLLVLWQKHVGYENNEQLRCPCSRATTATYWNKRLADFFNELG